MTYHIPSYADANVIPFPAVPMLAADEAYCPIPLVWPAKGPTEVVWRGVDLLHVANRSFIREVYIESCGSLNIGNFVVRDTLALMQVGAGDIGDVAVDITLVLDNGAVISRTITQPVAPIGPGVYEPITVCGEEIPYPGFHLPPMGGVITNNGRPIRYPHFRLPPAGAQR